MEQRRVQVVVTGRVQGVGYRASCAAQAQALGLAGWVRNRWDGAVEVEFEGPAEVVARMIAWCRVGPPAADVAGVQVVDAPSGLLHGSFHVR